MFVLNIKDMAELTNNHRYFIQHMLKNGFITVENAQKYCQHISKGEIKNFNDFKLLVIEINREISKQFYQLVFNVCEVTNDNYIMWLNTKNDHISKLQLTYSPIELEYFHTILGEIVQSEEHRILFIVCINITSTLTEYYSRENGQKVLTKWLKSGYFISKNPHIYLGPRLILEFTSYLKNQFPDSICNLCSELVFWGKSCNSCYKMFHSYCIQKYLSNQVNCPSCLCSWTTPIEDEIGDNVNSNVDQAEEGQLSETMEFGSNGSIENSQITGNKSGQRNNVRRRNISEDDYSSDEDPNEPGPSTRKRHR